VQRQRRSRRIDVCDEAVHERVGRVLQHHDYRKPYVVVRHGRRPVGEYVAAQGGLASWLASGSVGGLVGFGEGGGETTE